MFYRHKLSRLRSRSWRIIRRACVCLRAPNALMGGAGGGGRAAHALRLLFLLVMALAAVEYLFGSLFVASPLRTYLYTPLYNLYNSSQPSPKRNGSETTTLMTKLVDSVKISSTEPSNITGNSTPPFCELPSNLGPLPVNKTEITLSSIENKYPEVSLGGWYKPPNCTAKHKVAIIVPYRDRQEHLAIFLNHMHPFLMRQQLDYGIFVIEQQGNSSFNRAKLLNVGFLESNRLREGGWKCFVFHDVDRLPMDERNLYTCPRQPRHMSASVDKDNYKLPYADLFGGVSAMTYEQVQKVNGFSNEYWGWGCEDDDMSYRIRKMNYHIARYKMSIARYTMLNHKRQAPNPKRHILKRKAVDRMQTDGINTVDYNLTSVEKRHLLTHIIVDIEPWERKRKAHDKIKPNIGTKREIVKQRNREDKALSGNVRQRH